LTTGTSQVTTSFSTERDCRFPLSGSFDALALNVPGVTTPVTTTSDNQRAGISSNGRAADPTTSKLTANPTMTILSPARHLPWESGRPGKVSVITNDFAWSMGRASGSVVNYVTKSGSNDFHGSGFEYYEGRSQIRIPIKKKNPCSDLCSSNPAAGCKPVGPIPKYVENKFGGSIGGPIKRNKALVLFHTVF